MLWHVEPWELEKRISSEWITRMIAFRREFTFDPEGWQQTAQTNFLQSKAMGDKQSKLRDFIPTVVEQQSDATMETLMRAFAKSKKKKG